MLAITGVLRAGMGAVEWACKTLKPKPACLLGCAVWQHGCMADGGGSQPALVRSKQRDEEA
jgi:hypothetical protein